MSYFQDGGHDVIASASGGPALGGLVLVGCLQFLICSTFVLVHDSRLVVLSQSLHVRVYIAYTVFRPCAM